MLRSKGSSDAAPELHSAGKLIYQISREMRFIIAYRLRRHGLVAIDYDMLSLLQERTPISQEALVEAAIVEKSTVTKSLRRLEQKRIIHRHSDPTDRRKKWVEWGEQAAPVLADVTELRGEIAEALSVGSEEHDAVEVLSCMADSLHKHVTDLRNR
jgi:DNA-binding MarR family transcriptional regulator